MEEIKAPAEVPLDDRKVVFLAGSIEMGVAERWQDRASKLFADSDILIMNPRRDDWDSTWSPDLGCKQFVEQVEWEQEGLEIADFVLFYFDKDTISPITLLELGQMSQHNWFGTVVVCPEGYWRKGNVDVVCQRFLLKTASSLEDAVLWIKDQLPK